MSSDGSVTQWIRQLKADGEGAVTPAEQEIAYQELWNRYFHRLVALARQRLAATPRRAEDEEDAALSAFDSFFQRARQGQFPQLHDRDSLWPLLVKITARKVINQQRLGRSQRRGGAGIAGESGLAANEDGARGLEQIVSTTPSPEFCVLVADELDHRLASLPNASLRLVANMRLQGHTNREIADELGVVEDTVRRKLRRIRKQWLQEPAHEIARSPDP